MNHRRTPAPGVRPPRRNEARVCVVCGAGFVLDREAQPWSRARTCSASCRARLGNRGRSPVSCEHCVMVEGYHDERERQLVALEGGEALRDESARGRVIVFRTWLTHYPWAPAELVEEWSRVA